jgi:hypothetical protein
LPDERTNFTGFGLSKVLRLRQPRSAIGVNQRLNSASLRLCGLFLLKDQLSILRADFDPVAGLELTFQQAHGKRVENVFPPPPAPARQACTARLSGRAPNCGS